MEHSHLVSAASPEMAPWTVPDVPAVASASPPLCETKHVQGGDEEGRELAHEGARWRLVIRIPTIAFDFRDSLQRDTGEPYPDHESKPLSGTVLPCY
jgi:hypothetical protein